MLKTQYSPFKNKFLLAKSSEPAIELVTNSGIISESDDGEEDPEVT